MTIMLRKVFYFLLIAFFTSVVACKYCGMDVNNFALKTLSGVKKITNKKVNFQSLENVNSKPVSHELWSVLLNKHVLANGQVNYEGFKSDRQQLDEYLKSLSENPPNKKHWKVEERLAYWINAYNAFTVDFILEHYPIKSIKETAGNVPMVNSPWDIKFFKIGGIDFDLNTIEHDILRKMNEPRIHFAINCASESCPVLRSEAYTGDRLDDQLTDQTIIFINDPTKNIVSENEVQISKIFDWFKVDFKDDTSVISFIEKHGNVDLPGDVKVKYMDYDWSLNDAK